MLPPYSAYVPVHNQASTLSAVLMSLRRQDHPPAEILVIDDGSSEDLAPITTNAQAILLPQPSQLGRGAARGRALNTAHHEFVLSCDASNVLVANFASRGLLHFQNEPRLASVHGRVSQPAGGGLAHRWRGRHLFPQNPGHIVKRTLHVTSAAITRRSAALAVGNYRADLAAHEDSDLGTRLLAAGWDVWFDPELVAESILQNTLAQVFARYARWHEPRTGGWKLRDYPRNINSALRIMAPADLAAGDWPCALVSLLLPHYLLGRALFHPSSIDSFTPPLCSLKK
jgi:glycosyltransferase involved in cell wall biosynthesis